MTEKLSWTCDRLLSHQQLACCNSYCAIPLNGREVHVYDTLLLEKEPLVLRGHHKDIKATTFGKGNAPVFLCSASAEYVIVWDIEQCQTRKQRGEVAAGIVVGTLLGEVVHLSFCFCNKRVAACSGNSVYILNSKKENVISTLAGHLGPVTSVDFCSWNKNILVSTSEDRTFKIWDLKMEVVIYQSFVLSAYPLLSALFLEKDKQLITGSADGQVWCFSLSNDCKCHLVTKMDLQKMEKRHLLQQGGVPEQAGAEQQVEILKPVVQIATCNLSAHIDQDMDDSCFCIGSSDGLYVVNLATSELQTVFLFRGNPTMSISMAGSWSISPRCDKSMTVLVSSLFTPTVALLELYLNDNGGMDPSHEGFSVFPRSPSLLDSPLNAELKNKISKPSKKKGGVKDQPLVFHSKVKSSGYTNAPRRIQFLPKTNMEKCCITKKMHKNECLFHKKYPSNSDAPAVPLIDLSVTNKPISCLQYSGDGKQILCGLGDSSVLLYKSSLTGSPTAYIGHSKPVSTVSWSLSRQWWLSTSEDLSLRIWTSSGSEPAVIMNDSEFSKPIRDAQFYYLDKFILLASGSSLYLYLYNVDDTHDVIKRYKQRSVVKRVTSLTTPSKDITAMSAINDFLSYIVLACGSDRSIQVIDMNQAAVASVVPDAHSRAIHCITQNKGSIFTTQVPESYNLFLTSALTDGVKIWDLRNLKCVRRYENHLNRCHPCSSAISPCGRFIACGSEDKCAYMYDIRSSIYLHKLQRHSDTVLSVVFNPAKPELLTGTLDGKLRLFQSSSGSDLSQDAGTAM